MAKDGTRRGGNRAGAGRKPAKMPLPILGLNAVSEEKSRENGVETAENASKEGVSDDASAKLKRAQSGGKRCKSGCKSNKVTYDDDVPDLEGADVPPVDEYLRQEQKCGKSLKADFILDQTMRWLREIKCEHIVSRQLVEQYAMSVARWIQTEEIISQYGFLAKHPTTGAAIASPYVKMSQDYMKQVNQTWYQIYQIVRANVGDCFADNADDPMERLLRMRGG